MLKKAGRSYLLDSNLIKNVEDIAFRTRAARGAINRRQILNIGKGVVKDKNSSPWKSLVEQSSWQIDGREIY